ncbi:MAG TPA: hypothetical protein PLT91_07450 [Clostridia bacterium]|nr:hypothetical protein [Clostridia bacterium]
MGKAYYIEASAVDYLAITADVFVSNESDGVDKGSKFCYSLVRTN